MTCIIGIVGKDRVWMAADSIGSNGWNKAHRTDAKLFRNGPFLIGFTSSYRMGQLIRYDFKPPQPSGDPHRFMVSKFIPGVRKCLKDGGFLTTKDGVDQGGEFLVAVGSKIFHIQSDFQVGESSDGFDACGSGSDFALGSLWTSTGTERFRLKLALEAAERYIITVGGPFVYRSQKIKST